MHAHTHTHRQTHTHTHAHTHTHVQFRRQKEAHSPSVTFHTSKLSLDTHWAQNIYLAPPFHVLIHCAGPREEDNITVTNQFLRSLLISSLLKRPCQGLPIILGYLDACTRPRTLPSPSGSEEAKLSHNWGTFQHALLAN